METFWKQNKMPNDNESQFCFLIFKISNCSELYYIYFIKLCNQIVLLYTFSQLKCPYKKKLIYYKYNL